MIKKCIPFKKYPFTLSCMCKLAYVARPLNEMGVCKA